jgi:phi13 family phage major tail protein
MSRGVPIGLKDLYYALLQDDPASGTPSYAAPVKITGAIKANVNPNASNETLFADDGPFETATTVGQIGVELNVADLPLEVQAAMLGHTMEGAILKRKSGDVPPWLALGFRSLKSNGKYRYTWLGKGKFGLPEQANETKGDKINFQTPTIQGSFVKRDCDDEWERHIDEDSPNYLAAMGAAWFNDPLGGVGDVTLPTVSSVVPANSAAAQAVTTTVVWTFSEALMLTTLTLDNFMLVKDTDGAKVAGALAVNAARTVVTFTPSANLTAATAYRAIVSSGVKDAYGNAFAGPSVTKFTTA